MTVNELKQKPPSRRGDSGVPGRAARNRFRPARFLNWRASRCAVEFRVDQRFQAESTVRNRLLRRLPADELSALLPLMRPVEISARQVLHHWNLPMEHVYFIESGLVSVSAKIGGDRSVEAWLIGSEGMTGISVLLEDADNPPHRRV